MPTYLRPTELAKYLALAPQKSASYAHVASSPQSLMAATRPT